MSGLNGRASDAARAEPIVEEYRKVDKANADRDDDDAAETNVTAAGTWICANCGRQNEPQFDRCWHCTHERQGGTALA